MRARGVASGFGRGTVSSLRIYPLKSAGGQVVTEAVIERWGVRDDRRWALVDGSGTHPWLGEMPVSLAITAQARPDGGVRLSHPSLPDLDLRPEECGAPVRVDFPGLQEALPAPAGADVWVTKALGRNLRLIHLPEGMTRAVTAEHGGLEGEVTGLAWDAPLHLVAKESLDRLGEWIAETDPTNAVLPLDVARFRPNVVVDGFEPFAEDRWGRVRIGDVEFRVSELCDRCAVTLHDPTTLSRGKEPIRTLARRRAWGGKTWFGIRLVPLNTGTIEVGASVEPLLTAGDE